MSADKRRKARIQGGWASSPASVRSDRDKIAINPPQVWFGKNSSDPAKPEPFVFQEPSDVEDFKPRPKERVIQETGVFDLGVTENGTSRIRLFNNFISQVESERYFKQLLHEIPWRQRSDEKNGVKYEQPRLTAWYGEFPYSYSGVTHDTNMEWSATLLELKAKLEENTGLGFNSMLANLYRDGHDSVAWHADDEQALGPNPTIVSLSFGDVRNFEMRQKLPKGSDESAYDFVERIKIPIKAGTLLIMEEATQEDWQHRIPREYHDRTARINLTFRVILPPT